MRWDSSVPWQMLDWREDRRKMKKSECSNSWIVLRSHLCPKTQPLSVILTPFKSRNLVENISFNILKTNLKCSPCFGISYWHSMPCLSVLVSHVQQQHQPFNDTPKQQMAQAKEAKNAAWDLTLTSSWCQKMECKYIIYEKNILVAWARKLDDLIDNLWLIHCPLSLF